MHQIDCRFQQKEQNIETPICHYIPLKNTVDTDLVYNGFEIQGNDLRSGVGYLVW